MISSQLYLIYLIGIMIVTGIIKKYNLFAGIYNWLIRRIKNKRLLVFIISALSGILPVPGRCVVSASLLDTIATKDIKKRQKFGIIDYLSTHHYYFWSPLEKTVIIPMAALGLTYLGFLSYIWPLLVCYLIFTFIYIFWKTKEQDIELSIVEAPKSTFHIVPLLISIIMLICNIQPWIVFGILPIYYIIVTKTYCVKEILSFINWRLVIGLSLVLFTSNLAAIYIAPLVSILSGLGLVAICIWAFSFAFVLGSSTKFAGIVVMLCSIFGIQYLPLFFGVEFSGYLLSPTHKCVIISKEYFRTKISNFYRPLLLLVCLIIIVAIISIL